MGLAKAADNMRGRARLLISMAGLRYTRRRYGPAEEANTEAMGLFERIGDERGYLEALSNAPFFLVPNGHLAEAITAGCEAYERLNAGGQAAAAHAYSQVGLAHLQAGRPEVAVEVLTEIVAGARKQGIRTLIARDTYWLGQAQLALGRHAEAEESFTELTAYARDVGSPGAFYTAHAWGCLHLARGEYAGVSTTRTCSRVCWKGSPGCGPRRETTPPRGTWPTRRLPFLVGQTTGTLSDRVGLLFPSFRADTGRGGRA